MSATCPSCHSEHLSRRRVHRNRAVVVFLGHLLLVPSILVVLFTGMGVVTPPPQLAHEDRAAAALLAERLAADIAARRPLSVAELAALSPEQHRAARRLQ